MLHSASADDMVMMLDFPAMAVQWVQAGRFGV
jgi:hypothetical protein